MRIVHLEDEPAAMFKQLDTAGLFPGMIIDRLEKTSEDFEIWVGGTQIPLTNRMAKNVSVIPLATPQSTQADTIPLKDLVPGESAEVVSLSPRCRGLERRRLMDLGVLKGTVITAEFCSPSRDPVAYRIRGALIALRQEQTALINMRRRPT